MGKLAARPLYRIQRAPHLGLRAVRARLTTTPRITLVRGDITEQAVDAIVNAANASLMGGGGVDGAIHRRGGPEILKECKRIRVEQFPEGLPTGEAVATTAGRLPATWVIHTVGPVYSKRQDRSALLASCHTESLKVADDVGAKTVAFPAISTGVYGYPVERAAPVAIDAIRNANTEVEEVRFVLFDQEAYEVFARALGAAGPTSRVHRADGSFPGPTTGVAREAGSSGSDRE